MPGPLLTHDEINALVDAALACGFEELNSRSLLFYGIPRHHVAGLKAQPSPLNQLRYDLESLSQTPALEGVDEPPLALWLRNAAERAQPRLEARIFREMRVTVLGRAAAAAPQSVSHSSEVHHQAPPGLRVSAPPLSSQKGTPMPNPDVLLVCALKDEYDQVLKVTNGLQAPWTESHDGPRGWTVARANFDTPSGPLSILTTWATHMGREHTSAVVNLLMAHFDPKALTMSGICAGRRDEVSLGDVIFADSLWSYDAGKQAKDEDGQMKFWADTVQYRPPPVWVNRIQGLDTPAGAWQTERPRLTLEAQELWVVLKLLDKVKPREDAERPTACPDWTAVLKRLRKRKWIDEKGIKLTAAGRAFAKEHRDLHPDGPPKAPDFRIHVAPIATGAEVREDAGIFPRLRLIMRKVLGVEMEASALGAVGAIHDLPVLVAKAASDFGDEFKDNRYRTFAARAAAECLIALLCRGADLLIGANARPQ